MQPLFRGSSEFAQSNIAIPLVANLINTAENNACSSRLLVCKCATAETSVVRRYDSSLVR